MQTSIITFDGKLDNLVGFKNNKGTYSLRKRIKPTNPQTEKQVIARARFKLLSTMANEFRDMLAGLYPYASRNKITLRNAFMKENYPLVQNITPPTTGAIDTQKLPYDTMQLTHGIYPSVYFQTPDYSTPKTIRVIFDTPPSLNPTDIVHLVAYFPALGMALQDKAPVSNSLVVMPLDSQFSGEVVQLWGYTQHFLNDQARIDYEAGGDKVDAFIRSAAMNSEFSATYYLGQGTIG